MDDSGTMPTITRVFNVVGIARSLRRVPITAHSSTLGAYLREENEICYGCLGISQSPVHESRIVVPTLTSGSAAR
jgi:hypothetical protein